ncbi:hypothetical protein [Halobacterium wangiae]|uniref:hypothetical protein n=1 Tax=Halobacterium wangiae TaxID=2902623 RepID=UPI001E45A104|nr:hypothetical protein [Halobacterium wangiae]
MVRTPRSWFLRDTVIATVVLAGLYGLAVGVQFQPVQIPGYLLLVGFGVLDRTVGPSSASHPVLFAAYLLALGFVGATVAHVLSTRVTPLRRPWWRVGVAAALALVGVLSLGFAVAVLLGTSQLEPVLVTGAAGLLLLGLASWLSGLVGVRSVQ